MHIIIILITFATPQFENTNSMDIVSRLKKFMDYRQIAISQFADTCNIPRPTISQILNGRNKKISDELIGKIHIAFPDLSIIWLMFGEGEMDTNSNIKISEAQKHDQLTFNESQILEHELFQSEQSLFSDITEISPKNTQAENNAPNHNSTIEKTEIAQQSKSIAEAISNKIEPSKKITSIVVFYADNTFQTFNPS